LVVQRMVAPVAVMPAAVTAEMIGAVVSAAGRVRKVKLP
jgi:hypothetical protein